MSKLVIKNNINSELSITHADNKPAKSIIGTDITVAVDTINDFQLGASDGDTVIVRDLNRGGTFIYDSSKIAEHNDGTNFNGWIRQYSGAVNVKWFGAVGDGVTDDSTLIQNAYSYAVSTNSKLYIPTGNYKAKVVFDENIEVYGDGAYQTIFTKVDNNYVISMSSTNSSLEGAKLRGIGIDNSNGTGTGLILGGSGASNQGTLNNAQLYDVKVSNCDIGIYVSAMISTTLIKVTADYNTTYGIRFRNEGPNTTNAMLNCRFRQNGVGMYLGALMVSTFTSCAIESNKDIGIMVTGSTTNTTSGLIFNTCWLENNGYSPTGNNAGLESALYLDFNSSVGNTYSHNITFNGCIFSSPTNIYNVHVQRAMKVYFEKCYFTEFSSTYLYYNVGMGIGEIYLNECSQWKIPPTEAMYANMPALATNDKGFKYKFKDNTGKEFSNIPIQQKVLTLVDSATAYTQIDCFNIDTIMADTTNGDITLRSINHINAVIGQTINISKYVSANTLTIVHSADSGGFVTVDNSDKSITGRSVVTAVFNGISWNLNV